jgi:hypothetical protein
MKKIKYLVFLILLHLKTLNAADIYDGHYLSIPQVIVGDKTYINVVVTLGSVISVGGTLANPTIYVNIPIFQLSKFLSNGLGLDVLSNTNQTVSTQFNLSHQEYSSTTHTYTKFDTYAVGNFYLPSAYYASIQGITGVLTSLNWGSGGVSSWSLNNANVDAKTLTGTWQLFWKSVYDNSATVMASSLNNGSMSCISSRGQSLTQPLTSNPIDVKAFILSCIS